MQLNEVVPWGRSLEEYTLMFDLSPVDLEKHILGCGDGPASFNAEMTARGASVVSVDPVYAFSSMEIQGRVEATYESIISQVKQNPQRYVWDQFQDADDLGRVRLGVMRAFLADYAAGSNAGRYVPAALPALPFSDGQFDLCLCSHFLFLYSAQLDLNFHLESIHELLRVAGEARFFPLLDLNCQPSPHLAPVQAHFAAQGCQVEVGTVPYEFQRGGNRMLTIRRSPATHSTHRTPGAVSISD